MKNINIIKEFDSTEMGKFIAECTLLNWDNAIENRDWLEKESEDGKLRTDKYIWRNMRWEYINEGYIPGKYSKSDSWPLKHILEILEAVLATADTTTSRVLVVIPAIESGHKFDDFRDVIHYKGMNFNVWSDFFDLRLPEDDIEKGEEITRQYMEKFHVLKFMRNHPELVSTFNVYYKDKNK